MSKGDKIRILHRSEVQLLKASTICLEPARKSMRLKKLQKYKNNFLKSRNKAIRNSCNRMQVSFNDAFVCNFFC